MICTIIASGNSLRNFDFTKTKGDVFLINNLYQFTSNFDRIFCYDKGSTYKASKNVFLGAINTPYPVAKINNLENDVVTWEIIYTNKTLSRGEKVVSAFNSSVCFAINAAINLNYKTIYLLGVDNCLKDGYIHFYDKEKAHEKLTKRYQNALNLFNNYFKIIAKCLNFDEKIIAVESSLDCFDSMTMNEYLKSF